ncbi:hypothetical protein BGZ76_009487 [Entomortierella beljakovae]|nr:hypothetical protein BGZ76_009487 [Entomortierella beljakovae]
MAIIELPSVLSIKGQGPPAGTPIRSFILTDESSPGMACQIMSLGATLTHLWVPDSKNGTRDVLLGFDDLTAYRSKHDPYFGASVGRVANRIGNGKFSLPSHPDVVYNLDLNLRTMTLHGGTDGFTFRNWEVESLENSNSGTSLKFSLVSEHLDQGFPGRIRVQCVYRLFNSSIEVTYNAILEPSEAEPQTSAIVSLTNHAYFNLNGVPTSETTNSNSTISIKNHVMEMLGVGGYLETNDNIVPTGNVLPLDKTPAMDFRASKAIGDHILQAPGDAGYDHFFPAQLALDKPDDYRLCNDVHRKKLTTLVKVYSPESGIHMSMASTEPGFQLYTANTYQLAPNQFDTNPSEQDNVDPRFSHVGKARGGYLPHSGFCLETSRFPDAINHPQWRDQVVLNQGETYESITTFNFSIK